MTQQIGKVTVRTPGQTSDRKVKSIQYGIRPQDKLLSSLTDVEISANTTNAILTYDANSQIFTVQTLPEIDGGFF